MTEYLVTIMEVFRVSADSQDHAAELAKDMAMRPGTQEYRELSIEEAG